MLIYKSNDQDSILEIDYMIKFVTFIYYRFQNIKLMINIYKILL